MPKHEVTLYNSVSGNLHSVHTVEAENAAEAITKAQKESDEAHGYNEVVRPAYRPSVVLLDEPVDRPADTDDVDDEE